MFLRCRLKVSGQRFVVKARNETDSVAYINWFFEDVRRFILEKILISVRGCSVWLFRGIFSRRQHSLHNP